MLRRVGKISLGIVLIIVGIFGLVLPFIPGIILILLGLSLVSNKSPKILVSGILAKVKVKVKAKEKAG